jgi:hypothetical protein
MGCVTYLGDFRPDDPEHFEKHPEALRQVDRMGNPPSTPR